MNDFLGRLRKRIEWWVIEPQTVWTPRCCGRACQLFETTPMRVEVANARRKVFIAEGYKSEDDIDSLDPLAWQVVARERRTQQVVGALRIVFIDRSEVGFVAQDILELGQVGFACAAEEAKHRQAIEILLETSGDQFFAFVGGLFTTLRYRRTGLGAALILAGDAVLRIVGCRTGVSFGTTRNNTAAWFNRLGTYNLEMGGIPLPPFVCTKHRTGVRTLGLDPLRVEDQFDGVVDAFVRALQAQRVERDLRQCHYRGAATMLQLGMDGIEHDSGVASTETQRAEFSLRQSRMTPVAAQADVLWRDREVESSSVTC